MTDTATSPEPIEVSFKFEKETKNTIRYEEVHEPTAYPVLRNLYIGKVEYAKMGNPQTIKVTIEAV